MGKGKWQGEYLAEVRFPGHAERLKICRAFVATIGRLYELDETTTGDLVLAVDEACQNVVRHSYNGGSDAEIHVMVRREKGVLLFFVRDFGPKVDPGKVRPRQSDTLRPGGLGTYIISEVMDSVSFIKQGKGNLLRMVKRVGENGA